MTDKEKMLNGLLYNSMTDELVNKRLKCKLEIVKYNKCNPKNIKKLYKILDNILGEHGENIWIEQPFRCDYGKNINIGNNFYANYNCIMLDCAEIIIGDNVMFGPNVSLFTAGHPILPEIRNAGYEYAIKIKIGSNVWIGGNTVVNPGVNIGDNVVIGSGSVVTKDIPSNTIAVGSPCRVIREISDKDKMFYFKDKKIEDI